jgi:hypothetical protein
MSRISRVVLSLLLVGAFLPQIARAELRTDEPDQAPSNTTTPQDAQYAEGTKAMDEQRWSDAVAAFDRAAAAKGQLVDASLYWKAYSLDKLSRKDESRATCDGLMKLQPSSPWNRECLVLRARSTVDGTVLANLALNKAEMKTDMKGMKLEFAPAVTPFEGGDFRLYAKGPASEDDIKLLALNSLMRQDPAKAMPLLRDFLKSDKPVGLREQALFVLSRSKDPQAQVLLTEIATAKGNPKPDPEIQRAAVQSLSLSRGKDAGPTLVEAYRGATDAGVKRAAINGLFLTHDAARLVDLARGEKDLSMKRDIVSQLSLMDDKVATDYMLELLK